MFFSIYSFCGVQINKAPLILARHICLIDILMKPSSISSITRVLSLGSTKILTGKRLISDADALYNGVNEGKAGYPETQQVCIISLLCASVIIYVFHKDGTSYISSRTGGNRKAIIISAHSLSVRGQRSHLSYPQV